MSRNKKIITRVLFTISALILLVIAVLAYMVHYTNLETIIGTGTIDLNLNDDILIFEESDLNLQPGDSVMKDMFVENAGTESFYYRIYLEDVEGELAECTVFNIYDESGELLGTFETEDFNANHYFTTGEILDVGEKVSFKMEIIFVEGSGDYYQDAQLSFNVVASAIQSKNN